MASVWLRTPDGRLWEVRQGTEEERRLALSGAEPAEAPEPGRAGGRK